MSPGKIRVSDVSSEMVEDLDFLGGRVIEMSLAFGHLVAATQNQVRGQPQSQFVLGFAPVNQFLF